MNQTAHTILLGTRNGLSIKASKWMTVAIGLLYSFSGILKFSNQGFSFESIGWFIFGIGFVIGAFLVFTPNRLSPKIVLDRDRITFKSRVFASSTHLKWEDIQSIKMGSYELTFLMKNGTTQQFNYRSNAEVSIAMKQALRNAADERRVVVVD